jgi:hypothetical protein
MPIEIIHWQGLSNNFLRFSSQLMTFIGFMSKRLCHQQLNFLYQLRQLTRSLMLPFANIYRHAPVCIRLTHKTRTISSKEKKFHLSEVFYQLKIFKYAQKENNVNQALATSGPRDTSGPQSTLMWLAINI